MVTKRARAKARTSPRTTPAARAPRRRKLKRTWVDDLIEIGNRIPDAELAKLPPDLSENFDHYAHGSPRQS